MYKLKTYRVDELSLPQPVSITIDGQSVDVEKVWRLSISGAFEVRALPAVIWVNGKLAGYASPNSDLSQVSTILLDDSLLIDGATIAFSYGDNISNAIELPDTLHFPSTKTPQN